MTHDQDIERVLDRWLSEGPTQMPERFLVDTLDRIDRAPQPRLAGLRSRLPYMHPGLRLAAAAAVVLAVAAVGAGIVMRTATVGGPPLAGAGTVPASLQAEWHLVSHGIVPGPSPESHRSAWGEIVIDRTTVTIWAKPDLVSSVSMVGPDRLELRVLTTAGYEPCHVGDVGTYSFGLSSGDRLLTLSPVSDACAERASLLSGEWSRTDLGALQPGRHEAARFRPFSGPGKLAYTVPAGWAGIGMSDGQFALGRPSVSDVAAIQLFSNAVPSDQVVSCDVNQGAPGVGRTPNAMAAWLQTLPGFAVSSPTPSSVGGLSGIMVDLSRVPGSVPRCPDGPYTLTVFGTDDGGWSSRLRLMGTDRARYILLDRGDGSALVVAVEAPGAEWDAFVADSMPIIDSFEFTR